MKNFLLVFVLSFFVKFSHAQPSLTCADIQTDLLNLSATGGGAYTLPAGTGSIECVSTAVNYMGESVTVGLLVPENIVLDLNSRELTLNLSGETSYGVHLAGQATIRNGAVRVTASSGPGDQSIWHSAVSVGAAYGGGGTVKNPSYFSKVGHWEISNLDITQPYANSAIQIMSEAHNGLISDILIRTSDHAVVGIGLDWGTVGPFVANDSAMSYMKELWLASKVYTTHPHDIVIQNITIESLRKNINDDNAGIRTSATHNITIRNVSINEAAAGIVFRAGDVGYEFAQNHIRGHAHKGMVLENFTIYNAHRKGVIVDGVADNVYRAKLNYCYDHFLNPLYPGIDNPLVRFGYIRGQFVGQAGVHLQYINSIEIEDLDIGEFAKGIDMANGVYNSTIWRSDILNNMEYGVYIYGADQAPNNIAVTNNNIYNNTPHLANQIRNVNASNFTEHSNQLTPLP